MTETGWVSTSTDLRSDVFRVRCHTKEEVFVVIDLGQATVFVYDLDVLGKLAVAVAEAHDLLAAALLGQDPLTVVPDELPAVADDLTAVPVGQDRPPVDEMAVSA